MSRTGRRTLGAGVALLATAVLSSCVQVPHSGGVVEAKPRGQSQQQATVYTNPPPPRPGDKPDDIVLGFLEAMTATPLRPAPATAYLTQQERTRWSPGQEVLTYAGHGDPTGGPRRVTLQLRESDRVGADGQWQGSVPRAEAQLEFRLEKENGEWRISRAPDAYVLQNGFYQSQFNQDASLYFFDPTGRILVPEPVHVPQGQQFASSLVQNLVRGPRSELTDVERSFIPPGLESSLSVGIEGSTAVVSSAADVTGSLTERTVRLMLAQLTYTLRQDTSITGFTLTIGGRSVTYGGRTRFLVDSKTFDHYDPAVSTSSGQAYALKNGLLVSGQVDQLSEVKGPFGEEALGIGPFAVNLDSTRVAAVTPGGMLLGPFQTFRSAPPRTVLTGPGLLRPSWDAANRLWTVQNGPTGAVVRYVATTSSRRGTVHQVRVPGISGAEVKRFLVSRDGSRMIAVLRGATADRLVVSRLRYDVDGRALRGTRAQPIPWSSHTTRIRDIGWTTPTTIAVLDQLNGAQAERRILRVDGSTAPAQAQPTRIPGVARGLATSPVGSDQTPYALLRSGDLYDISQVETAQVTHIEPGLRHLTYAG